MRSPGANRVRIIGQELLPELKCPPDPLPETLRLLLELLDAAEWRYRQERERKGPVSVDLRIEVEGEELLVTLPGTSYAVKYRRLAKQLYCQEYPMQIDRRSPLNHAEFIAKAWRIANDKARELGWIP
jgi:hypothetical protein